MSDVSQVKQIIVDSLQNLELPEFDPSQLNMFQRAVLGGQHPIEKAIEMIVKLPDEWMPHIIDVAKAIAKSAGD